MAACVCGDSRGTIVFAATKKLSTTDPTVGEAEALWLGVQMADRFSGLPVLFEGHSLVVFNSVERPLSDCPWRIESIIALVKSRLLVNPSFKCSFFPRCENVAATFLPNGLLPASGRDASLNFLGTMTGFPGCTTVPTLLNLFVLLSC